MIEELIVLTYTEQMQTMKKVFNGLLSRTIVPSDKLTGYGKPIRSALIYRNSETENCMLFFSHNNTASTAIFGNDGGSEVACFGSLEECARHAYVELGIEPGHWVIPKPMRQLA